MGGNPNDSEFSVLPRRKKRRPVHIELAKDEYEHFFLIMIIKNDLPFSLVQSESSEHFVNFSSDDAPHITRATMRRRLDVMYESISDTKGKARPKYRQFSITFNEWRSGNNFHFLGITLHFYNNKFELENHILGLKY